MTNVELYKRFDGVLFGFSCNGHTGFAKAGKDIVCAAVSFLSTTCVNALECVAGIKPEVAVSGGKMIVRLSEMQLVHDSQVILRVFERGMRDLAESYPDNIQFTMVQK